MSYTPETDAEAMDVVCWHGDPSHKMEYEKSKSGDIVPAQFARRLERERDEAREENKKFREALEWISKRYDDSKPTHQVAMDAYEMSCTAGSVLQKEAK